MPTALRTWLRAPVLAALTLLAVSGVATASLFDGVLEGGDLARLDRPTLVWLVGHRDPLLTSLMTGVSVVGGEVVLSAVAAFVVAVLAWRGRRVEAVLLGVALGAAETLSVLVKHLVGRIRPPASVVLGPVEHTLSFPSGHTIGTATFALGLAYLYWRSRPSRRRAVAGVLVASGVTVLMAVSRLYLADHWLTDVLASTTLAAGLIALVVLCDQLLQRRSPDTVHAQEVVAT